MTEIIHERLLSHISGLEYSVLEHDFVHTSADAAKVRGTKIEEAAKALVLHDKSNNDFFMCIIPGNERLDLKKIKMIRSSKNISLASPDDVFRVTGCRVGTVPPFPKLLGLEGYADKSLLKRLFVVFSAASHYKSIRMKSSDWLRFSGSIEEDIIHNNNPNSNSQNNNSHNNTYNKNTT